MEIDMSDESLTEDCLKGNDTALVLLIDRYTPIAYNYVRRLCGNDEEASDITQDSIIKMWRNIGSFKKEKGSFKTWIWKIIRNTTFDALRKRPHANIAFSAFDKEEGNAITDNLASEGPLQNEMFAHAEDVATLEIAMQKLSPQARDVLLLRYQEGLTFEEIGTTLNKPLNTVKSRHHRAIKSLKDIIGETNAPK